jgi:UMF1 family MFS transporter
MSTTTTTAAERLREQKAWNWYDWANSAFYTTVLGVLFGPYMIVVARTAACGEESATCTASDTVGVLGLDIAAGSLPALLTTFATVVSALLLPVVGAFVDRSPRKKLHMATFAWLGSASCALLFFMDDGRWQVGAVAIVLSSIFGGCSLVSYYAILVDVSTEEERDRVSSRGWAFGYLGGGLLLAVNLAVFTFPGAVGLDEAQAVRVSLLSAAIWWAGFTIIPFVRLRNRAPVAAVQVEGGLWARSFGQLFTTLKDMRRYPMTLTFLVAYLFYNDGIQTVVASASVYGAEELDLDQSVLIGAYLMIQFVAFGGALLFGRLATRLGGAYRPLLWGTFAWMAIVVAAIFLPAGNVPLFLLAGVAIAIVLGGTQALSRSFFSLLIPRGREGEYFALYNACERGTSWFGTLLFALVFIATDSYRPAIFALVLFFVLGAVFLLRLDPERGIAEAGNRPPAEVGPPV